MLVGKKHYLLMGFNSGSELGVATGEAEHCKTNNNTK